MNGKTRALLVIFFLLAAQLACSSPVPGLLGSDAQLPEPIYTITSLPPFPTATATTVATATAVATATTAPTATTVPTATTAAAATTAPAVGPSPTATSSTSASHKRPIAPVIARYLSTPPRLDGDWSDWKDQTIEYPANNLIFGRKQWSGAADLSASFHLGWDEKNLYLAIKVRDDHYVQPSSGATLYNGDSLELLLDSQLMEDYTSNQLSDDDFQLGISPGRPSPGHHQEAYLWTPNWLAGEVKTIQIETTQEAGVYRVEAAIPWAVFNMKPVDGQHYGFGLSVTDNDNGDSAVFQSMITNLPARHPDDPTTWGDLFLQY